MKLPSEKRMLDVATERFVDQATSLAPQVLAVAFDRQVGLRSEGGREASRAARISAAQNSQLERRIAWRCGHGPTS
ncbi:hypothetical protein [Catellatospora sp. NPDC049609]|uniref:hypothetical protein n=1 Tax=Catellatospora sp. NPDC049609 TaxID=3155505 RepID=UPI0034373B5D